MSGMKATYMGEDGMFYFRSHAFNISEEDFVFFAGRQNVGSVRIDRIGEDGYDEFTLDLSVEGKEKLVPKLPDPVAPAPVKGAEATASGDQLPGPEPEALPIDNQIVKTDGDQGTITVSGDATLKNGVWHTPVLHSTTIQTFIQTLYCVEDPVAITGAGPRKGVTKTSFTRLEPSAQEILLVPGTPCRKNVFNTGTVPTVSRNILLKYAFRLDAG